MATMSKRQVTFSDAVGCSSDNKSKDSNSEDEESFYEITTSEAESLGSTSDDEDLSKLDVVLQGAYSCNPAYFTSHARDAAQRNSLLLLDKDFRDSDSSSGIGVIIRS